jgi:pimeloyl-ACP methyl ester carboxylesterase
VHWFFLVHGLVISSRYMVPTAVALAPLCTVAAIDLPGYGDSAIRTGSVPFWMVFNKEPSLRALTRYLRGAPSFDEVLLTLFSHGVDSIGLVPIDKWRRVCQPAGNACFIGVDPKAFPRDFAVFVRYHFDFLRRIPARHPMPSSLTFAELERFLAETRGRYGVQWLD